MLPDWCSKGKGKKGKKKGRNKKAEDAAFSGDGSFEHTAGNNGYSGRGGGAAQQGNGAAPASLPVLPADRAVPDADAAQPGHLPGADDGDVASALARRLQAEWRVRLSPSGAQEPSCPTFWLIMPCGSQLGPAAYAQEVASVLTRACLLHRRCRELRRCQC